VDGDVNNGGNLAPRGAVPQLRQSEATVAYENFLAIRMPIVAMEQVDDAGFCGRNPFIFNAVNTHGRLVGLASSLTRISDAALCNSLDCRHY
jgi:hypothetical protein